MQPEVNYKEALRLGQKEVRARAAKNESTALPVLDEIIPAEKTMSGLSLGVLQIPMWFIVGTKTAGRVGAFAPNFMPLLAESTEFASKWESLYRSHMSEGIREPIKVYEYLNRYYVEEGNKRVSVLRYCGAYSIPADVTRIMPEKSDSDEVQLYLEYLDFNRYSKINFIEFSKRGSYKELLRAIGKPFNEFWSIEEQQRFSSTYYHFERAFKENGGDRLKTTVGDAMLSYIQIYGYSQLQNEGEAEIRNVKFELDEFQQKALKSRNQKPCEIICGIRPQHITVGEGELSATVEVSELLGTEFNLHARSGDDEVVMVIPTMDLNTDVSMGANIKFTVQPKLIQLFDKETKNNLIWYDPVSAEANAPECARY